MSDAAPLDATQDIAIRVRGVEVGFGARLILRGLDLDVRRGEVLGFVGGGNADLGEIIDHTLVGTRDVANCDWLEHGSVNPGMN
jgi:phospholipid/cholesterol/gamma-HCH transport system ATP-binding protein